MQAAPRTVAVPRWIWGRGGRGDWNADGLYHVMNCGLGWRVVSRPCHVTLQAGRCPLSRHIYCRQSGTTVSSGIVQRVSLPPAVGTRCAWAFQRLLWLRAARGARLTAYVTCVRGSARYHVSSVMSVVTHRRLAGGPTAGPKRVFTRSKQKPYARKMLFSTGMRKQVNCQFWPTTRPRGPRGKNLFCVIL
jgi:hypothetical protein